MSGGRQTQSGRSAMNYVGGMRRLIAALVCSTLVLVAARAQALSSLNGSVRDAQGALIPKATVTLVNNETGATRTTESSKDGLFQFAQLIPGVYEVHVEAAGFRAVVRKDVTVQVNTPLTLDLQLEVGGIGETVDVQSGGETINRTDASIGNTFNENQIRQLPIEGRNVVDLLSLQPGVTKTDPNDGHDD